MLSRRQLRIKVMQALYAFFQDEKHDLFAAEKELFRGIEKSYDLYLTLLQLLVELLAVEEKYLADKPKSQLSKGKTTEQKNRLHDNLFLKALSEDARLSDRVKKRKISWQNDHDLVQKIFHQVKKSALYENPEPADKRNWQDDVEHTVKIFKQFVLEYDIVSQHLEEKNIYFAESLDFIGSMIIKNIRASSRSQHHGFELFELYKDEEDDRDFVKNLFKDTVNNEVVTEKYITEKSVNWDIERIALLDVIILKMAISEIVRFSGIPVKVSINEYIDLSKEYSTPKSSIFINGVLDKIVNDLKTQGKIVKTGRGLIE